MTDRFCGGKDLGETLKAGMERQAATVDRPDPSRGILMAARTVEWVMAMDKME